MLSEEELGRQIIHPTNIYWASSPCQAVCWDHSDEHSSTGSISGSKHVTGENVNKLCVAGPRVGWHISLVQTSSNGVFAILCYFWTGITFRGFGFFFPHSSWYSSTSRQTYQSWSEPLLMVWPWANYTSIRWRQLQQSPWVHLRMH